MTPLRHAETRGQTQLPWLDSRHSFSFGSFHDPEWMGFRNLRVFNEDRIGPTGGFGDHGHREMEIVSIVLDGALAHSDSTGRTGQLGRGDVQAISAGTGVIHAERNPDPARANHFFQIWIEPRNGGEPPSYREGHARWLDVPGRWHVLASDQPGAAVRMATDSSILGATVLAGSRLPYTSPRGGHLWLHVVEGEIEIAGQALATGDAFAATDAARLEIVARSDSRVLLLDLD